MRGIILFLLLLSLLAPAQAQIALVASGSPFTVGVRTYRDIPFRTVVRQQYDYSCGSAALATLLRYHYGRSVGEAEIFKAMYISGNQDSIRKVGFSLLDMKKYLEGIGLQADGYRATLEDVKRNAVPVITVITIGKYRHFVLIKGIESGEVLIGDPALGLRKMSIADFQKIWNGIVFAIHGNNETKAVFNAPGEWRNWATAPIGQELDRASLLNMHVDIVPIYQILQLTPMSPN